MNRLRPPFAMLCATMACTLFPIVAGGFAFKGLLELRRLPHPFLASVR